MGTAFMTVPKEQQVINRQSGNTFDQSSGDSDLDRERSIRRMMNNKSTYFQGGQQPVTGELIDLTMSRLEVRRSALSRMEMEAELLNASGVVGVRAITKVHDWSVKTVEYTVFGTAVHIPGHTETRPFMSLLDGQEFWQLWTAGYEPRGIALGVCSYTDCTDYSTIHGRNYNQEIAAYTQSFYEAREIAMRRIVSDLKRMKARGAVGMKIDYDFEEAESEVDVSDVTSIKYLHLVTHLVVMGTAIARRKPTANDTPRGRTMLIYDLRKPGSASVEFTARSKGQEAGSED